MIITKKISYAQSALQVKSTLVKPNAKSMEPHILISNVGIAARSLSFIAMETHTTVNHVMTIIQQQLKIRKIVWIKIAHLDLQAIRELEQSTHLAVGSAEANTNKTGNLNNSSKNQKKKKRMTDNVDLENIRLLYHLRK